MARTQQPDRDIVQHGPAITAIVLAGGRSRRFGSDKLRAELGGVPLLHHAVRVAQKVADDVIVVGPHSGPPLDLADLDARIVRDRLVDEGPLSGAAAGLEAAAAEAVLLLAGDAPHVPVALLRALAAYPRPGALTLSLDGRARPMPSRLTRASGLAAAERLLGEGERRLRALLLAVDASILDEAWWRPFDPVAAWTHDIDRREDLS